MKYCKPFTFGIIAMLAIGLASCSRSSPTSTFKSFFEAQQKKDVAGMKKTLSKGSMAMLEKGAKAKNQSVDQAITEGFNNPASKTDKIPELRNEKIEGENATLEVQDEESKKWETVYFVKEDSDWKIALDKTVEEMLKKIGTSK
jgi:Domain of unknown function (DUF4878)